MLEIFTNNDEVIFKKYSVIESMSTVAKDILGAMYLTHKMPIIVCDTEKVIVAKGINKDEIVSRRITADLEGILERRKVFTHDESTGEFCFPVEGVDNMRLPVLQLLLPVTRGCHSLSLC